AGDIRRRHGKVHHAPVEKRGFGRRDGDARAVRDLRHRLGRGIGSGLVRRPGQALVPRAAVGVLPGRVPLLRPRGRRAVPHPCPRRRPQGQGRVFRAYRRRALSQRAVELRVLRPAQHARRVRGHSGVLGAPDGVDRRASQVRGVLGGAARPVLPVGAVRPRLDVRAVEAQRGGL
ncbi:MAG: hypothetical protein AVDCRST_MAG01-01-2074, partial [uncultured Rubrobacteraceae bacterium]